MIHFLNTRKQEQILDGMIDGLDHFLYISGTLNYCLYIIVLSGKLRFSRASLCSLLI